MTNPQSICTALRDQRQRTVIEWAERCFGRKTVRQDDERALRLLEEAMEVAQALDVSQERCVALLDHVYGRPAGTIDREIGGVCVTLLALCEHLGHSADLCERHEISRILSLSPGHFAERQAAKARAGVAGMPVAGG